MKIPHNKLLLAIAVLAGTVCSAFGQSFYLNDFTEEGFPNIAHGNTAGSFNLNTVDGIFNYTRTQHGSHTVSTASVDVSGVSGNDFVVSSWFVLNEMATNTSSSVFNNYGFGLFGEEPGFLGSGSSGGNSFYLVSFRPSNNSGAGSTRQSGSLNITRQGDSPSGWSPGWSDSPAGGLQTETLYELRATGTYENGTLTLVAGIYDEFGNVVGDTRTAVDETPLTGVYFGFRHRIVSNTLGTVDIDHFGYSIGDEPMSPPTLPAPLLVEITNLNPEPDSIFNSDAEKVEFTVSTQAPNFIDPADIHLVLNDVPVPQQDLVITGSSPSFNVSHDGLAPGLSYTAEVIASDNERTATRTWSFRTLDPDSLILEDVPLDMSTADAIQGLLAVSTHSPSGSLVALTNASSPTGPTGNVILSADETVTVTWDLGTVGSRRALTGIDIWLAGSDPWRTGYDGEFATSNDGVNFTPVPGSRLATALTYTGPNTVIGGGEVEGTGSGGFNRVRYQFDPEDFSNGFRYLQFISYGFNNLGDLDENRIRQPRIVEIDAFVTLGTPHITAIDPVEGASFHSFGDGLRFGVTTAGGVIVPGDVDLFLNGEPVSPGDLSISGASPEFEVFLADLEPNQFYTVTAVARDGGQAATHTWSFDTLEEADVFVIEAEDYNFGDTEIVCPTPAQEPTVGGLYFNDPTPSTWDGSYYPSDRANAYVDRRGVPGIDFNTAAERDPDLNLYRLCDAVGTAVSNDPQRPKYKAASVAASFNVPDYHLHRVQTNEWFNYTRTFPAGTYRVLLRASATGSPVVRLDRVTSDPTAGNQTTEALGNFIPVQTGAFDYIPLTDDFGQPVLVPLSGEDTLRLSAVSANNNVNLNFLLLIPVAELPPIVVSTSPAQGTGHVPPDDVTIEASLEAVTYPIDLGSLRLFVNDVEVSANVAGAGAAATVSATAGNLPGLENIARVEFDDVEGTGPYSSQWSFFVLPDTRTFYGLHFSGDQQFVDITEAASTFNDFTVSGWFKIEQRPAGVQQYLYRITNRESNTRRIEITEQDGTLTATFRRTTSSSTIAFIETSDFEYDTWVHIAFVREGAQIRLYLNGVEVAGSPVAASVGSIVVANKSYLGGNPHMPGNWNGIGSDFFKGYIDEFQIWNVARTPQEITDSMFEPLHELIEPGHDLHARFGLNEGGGSQTFDYSTGFTAPVSATWVLSEIFESEMIAIEAGELLWANADTIRAAGRDGSNQRTHVTGLDRAVGIAVDAAAGQVYYSDDGAGAIGRINFDGTGLEEELIPGRTNPQYVALTEDRVFWTEFNSGLWSATRNGDNVLNTLPLNEQVSALAIDRAAGKVYVASSQQGGQLHRVNFDGGNPEILGQVDLGRTFGMALDSQQGILYATDLDAGNIVAHDLVTGDSTILYGGRPLPLGIAVSEDGSQLFWAERVNASEEATAGRILTAPANGLGPVAELAQGLNSPFGVALAPFAAGGTFADWIAQFGLPSGQNGPNDDPAGDGIPNIVRYALDGGDPRVSNRGILPLVGLQADNGQDYLTLATERNPDAVGVSLVVEVSADLVNWFSGPVHTTVLEDTATELVVRDNQPIDENSRRFIRLRVIED